MSSAQDSTLAKHKEDALRDLQALLHPNADTCEAALRELANKWWAIFQERGNSYAHFRHYAGGIYRHTLQHMIDIDPGEGEDLRRQNFCKFTQVLMRNVPRDYWVMFFLQWHDFQIAYLQAELGSDPDIDKSETVKMAEALKELQTMLKDG